MAVGGLATFSRERFVRLLDDERQIDPDRSSFANGMRRIVDSFLADGTREQYAKDSYQAAPESSSEEMGGP